MSKLKWSPIKIKLGQIKPWKSNPRLSTKAQAHRLIKSERELGQLQTIAVGPFRGGDMVNLYDGHQRVSAWLTVKSPSFEVIALQSNRELDADERRKISILLHTATGSWDWDALSSWNSADLGEWGMDNDTLKNWQDDTRQLSAMLQSENENNDAEPQINKAAELLEKWGCKTGDMYAIGEHRLIVGNCTDAEVVARVMGAEKANVTMTSPPYWVGKEYETQENRQEIVDFIKAVSVGMVSATQLDESRIVINTGTARASAVENNANPETWLLLDWWIDNLREHGYLMRHCRVWVKNGGFPAPRSPVTDIVDQHWEFIATFYNPKGKQRGQNRVDSSWAQSGYWDFVGKMTDETGLHKAAFPVELPSRIIGLYAKKNEIVYDPFGGSGTTMVACENLNRQCRMIEMSEKYCAVILQRMQDAFPEIQIDRVKK